MGVQIKVSFSGASLKRLGKISQIAKNTQQGIRRAHYLIGKELEKDAKLRILKGKKTGRVYKRLRSSGRVVTHRASAPGESPANFTGALRASVGFVAKGQLLEFGAGGDITIGRKKGAFVGYARTLELGDRRKKIAPRPYLIAAIRNEDKIIRNYYKQYIKKELLGKK